jgi:23S rRNA (pseudouridine1915-N3)-methyltransferase
MTSKIGTITIIAVGKVREKQWQAALAEYKKRLHFYTNFKLVEVKDAVGRFPDTTAVQREGEQLLKAAADSNRTILLSAEGKAMDSSGLARFLQTQIERYGRLAFLIGGPLGFAAEVTAAADEQLSLSRLTFPHELARVILLEQLYRAFTILNNEPYHK